MKDIQQLIKKNSQENRYKNIFPKTYIDAIKDKESGVTLADILAMFNMLFLSYNGSRGDTRLQVPTSLRRTGLWVTYVLFDKTVVTEWYAGEAIDDTSWASDANWREGSNMLVGDISISTDGYWVINGVVTTIKAQGEQGITPLLRVGPNNHLQVSYTQGSSYIDVSSNPVYTQFRVNNNKLEQSVDLGQTWTVSSDYIAAWFRFTGTAGSSQADNVGKIQISRDNGTTWTDLSGVFTNGLYIKGYVATVSLLPSSAVQGDIYGVGPTYDPSDPEHTNPIYQLYVKDSTGWVNNGRFTSISAGVVQELGNSETSVISQKAVTECINDLYSKTLPLKREESLVANFSNNKYYSYIVEVGEVMVFNSVGNTISYNVTCTYEDNTTSTIIPNIVSGKTYNFTPSKKIVAIGYFNGSNPIDFTVTLWTNSALTLRNINNAYNTNLKWGDSLAQIINRVDSITTSVNLYNYFEYFLKAGMLLKATATNNSQNIALGATYSDGTTGVIYPSLPNGVETLFVPAKDIVALGYSTSITQNVNLRLEAIDRSSTEYKDIQTLQEDKVDKSLGKNLFNKNTVLHGYFIWRYGIIEAREGYAVSDYIKVTGDVISNVPIPSGMGANIYDRNKVKLRTITTNQYTYQEGDYFMRYTVPENRLNELQIESGNTITPYEMFTTDEEMVERFDGNRVFEVTENISTAQQLIQNGAILREKGMDIPAGSTGSGSMIEFNITKVSNDCIVDFITLTNIPASAFNTSWSSITQESTNIVRFRMSPTQNALYSTFKTFVQTYNTDTTIDRYIRISRVQITPLTGEAQAKCLEQYGSLPLRPIYEVCKDFTSTTTGFGTYRFNSVLEASVAIPAMTPYDGITVRIMPGIYDDFATKFPVTEGETPQYKGIITKDGTTYESFDPNLPELTKLVWDGHSGLPNTQYLNQVQAMNRAVFHVNINYISGLPVVIRGLHIISSNCRYCIHPESSGFGYGRKWTIDNCILEWNGNPYVIGFSGRHLGIGISSGETGIVNSTLFTGTTIAGIGGHNNGFVIRQTGTKPLMIRGANLKVINCTMSGNDIIMNVVSNDATTFDTLEIIGTKDVRTAKFGFETSGVVQNWKGFAINSTIQNNQM